MHTMENPHFTCSVVIPVFNEERAIAGVLDDLLAHGLTKHADIIVVDDGSTDGTAAIIQRYPVTLLQQGTNKGYGAALKAGIRASAADKIIILDSDGQHRGDDVGAILAALHQYPMVIGERSEQSSRVRSRVFGKWIIRQVGEFLVEQTLPDFNSGMRGFDRRIMKSFLHLMPNGFSFSTTSTLAFLKQGYAIGTVPITVRERVGRRSSVRPFRDGITTVLLLLRLVMLFNPLKIFLPASVAVGIWGLGVAINDICAESRVSNGPVTVMVMAMFLFFFGLLADQIAMLNLREKDHGPA